MVERLLIPAESPAERTNLSLNHAWEVDARGMSRFLSVVRWCNLSLVSSCQTSVLNLL